MAGNSEKIILIVAITVVAIIVVGAFSFMNMMGGYGCGGLMGSGMIGSGMMGGSGMGFGWMLLWPILVIAIIVGAYFIFTGFKREEQPSKAAASNIEILKERYAKGEITEKEFKKMKKDLAD